MKESETGRKSVNTATASEIELSEINNPMRVSTTSNDIAAVAVAMEEGDQ